MIIQCSRSSFLRTNRSLTTSSDENFFVAVALPPISAGPTESFDEAPIEPSALSDVALRLSVSIASSRSRIRFRSAISPSKRPERTLVRCRSNGGRFGVVPNRFFQKEVLLERVTEAVGRQLVDRS